MDAGPTVSIVPTVRDGPFGVAGLTREAGSTLGPGRSRDQGGHVETAIFDADSHLMETPEWLGEFADEGVRDQLWPLGFGGGRRRRRRADGRPARALGVPPTHEDIGREVLNGPKGWMAPGALDAEVRSRVLDALDIEAQLVFPTFALAQFSPSRDPECSTGGPRR